MKSTENECCGKCEYHKHKDGEWICDNPASEYYSDWTGYSDNCPEYESRE